MKTRERLVLLLCTIVLPCLGIAQCGTTHTISYDSTVSGVGGTDTPYDLTFPKFDIGLGTLLDVKIISVLTIIYQYDIENNGAAKADKLRVSREDEITSSALSDPIYNDYTIPSAPNWITHNLGANDGVTGSGPDFLSVAPFDLVNHDTIINQSAVNPADFLGSGNISFDYSSSTSLLSSPLGGSTINNTAATDQIKFILQYVYCDNIALATEITSFTASRNGSYIDLQWLTSNELPNYTYEVQKSDDGKNFVAVTVLASNGANQAGNYQYNYVPRPDENGKLYFRIRQVETNGASKYSPLRVVDAAASDTQKGGMRLVPNPSSRGVFSIMLDNAVASNWNIELFNIKGQVISSRQVNNVALTKFKMNETLSAGVYFVVVTDKKNNQKFVERLIVN